MEQQKITNGGLQFVPQIAVQYVYLDFDGELTFYNGEILTVDNVKVQNSSLTTERIAYIVTELNAQYADRNVIFVTEKPTTAEYSTIYVGKTSAFDRYGNFAGLAETIDSGNKNKTDKAFVMLDSTASNEAIISTISHETDHLLGTLDHSGSGLAAYAAHTIIGNGVSSTGLTISSGNSVTVSSGGTANYTTVNAGSMHISSGGKAGTFIRKPEGAEDFTGDIPLQERINLIKDADFFIGLSSGLSWLAWCCKVPVVMISGFTHPTNEFETPYRVINYHTCHSCWNDMRLDFDHFDFLWCPRHKGTDRHFECTKLISAEQVITTIKKIPTFKGNE